MKINEKGQVLIDLEDEILKKIDNTTRYNGGWVKSVTGLDQTKTNGYSIIGEFLKSGVQWLSPGLYLDCSKGGSRKHQDVYHSLVKLNTDGTIELLQQEINNLSWAVALWDKIEKELSASNQITGKQVKDAIATAVEMLSKYEGIDNSKKIDFIEEATKLIENI